MTPRLQQFKFSAIVIEKLGMEEKFKAARIVAPYFGESTEGWTALRLVVDKF